MKPKSNFAQARTAATTPPAGGILCQCGAHGIPPHDESGTPSLSGSLPIVDITVEGHFGAPCLLIAVPGPTYFDAMLTQQAGAALLDMLNRSQAEAERLGIFPTRSESDMDTVSWSRFEPLSCAITPTQFCRFSRHRRAFELSFDVTCPRATDGNRPWLHLTLGVLLASALRYRLARLVE